MAGWKGLQAAFLSDPEGVASVMSVKIQATTVREKRLPSIQTELAWVIEVESNWNPAARNEKSDASGLIQFTTETAKGLGTTTAELRGMSRQQQAPYVQAYFDKVNKIAIEPGDVYLMVAAPGFVGKRDFEVVYPVGSKAWEQNPGWRTANDGPVTVGKIRAVGIPPTEMIPGLAGGLSKPQPGEKPKPIPGGGKTPQKPSKGGSSSGGAFLLILGLFLMSRAKKSKRR